jgi:hypothetical protein
MKNIQTKYKLNFKTMKKGLLTLLAASLVFVGCQNYDDQFDDLNAQISALKSQVDGLSALSGQVASLSGTISGLQAGISQAASSSSLSALSASLTALQADVDAVQASLATAATASAVTALQAEVAAIQADVTDLLSTSNVYNQNLTISSASTLDAAVALGNNINIVNGSVTITQSSTMDATKLQGVIDKIFTVTGNYSYTAANTNVTAMTFNKLASTGDLTLKVNGPIHANALVTAGTITLDDSYISKVTAIHMDALTTVTEIQTDSGGTDNIVFTSATDVQLGALAVYAGAGSDYGLTITTKADATLDIGSLDDVKTDGTAAPVALTLNGPKDVTISNMTAYAGSLSLTNVENATITGFKGPITVNGGVENITMTDVEDFAFSSATALKTVTLDVDKASDPALTNTQKAPSAYGGSVTGYTSPTPGLSFASMSSLTSVTLTGFYDSLSFDGLANLTTIDIDAMTGDLTINNNDNLTSVDLTGSEIGNVTFTNNDAVSSVEFDHSTDLNFHGATTDRKSVTHTVTGNTEMTSFTNSGASSVMTFTLTGNTKLATIAMGGMAAFGTATTSSNPVVDVYSNALVASQASDTDDGLTQYSIDGTNDTSDLGSYTTTSGMETLKTYLTAVNGNAKADANVHFDTVQLHNIASDAATSSETAGDQNSGNAVSFSSEGNNDVTLVYSNTASTLTTTTTGDNAAVKNKIAWLLDVSSSSTLTLQVETIHVLEDNGTFGTLTLTGNNTVDVAEMTSSLSTTRATNLGVTLTAAATGNPVLPAMTFLSSISSAEGSNGENYTNTSAASLSSASTYAGAAVPSYVTSYDVFTLSYGGKSVTASLAAADSPAFGPAAAANVASTLMNAWNLKYSTGSASANLSGWTTGALSTATITAPTLKSSLSGGRFFGDVAAVTWTAASAAQASMASSGAITTTRIAWKIGSSDATTDNSATGTDIIIALEETVAGNGKADRITTSSNATLTVDGTIVGTVENAQSNSFGLVTNLISVGSSAANTDTTSTVYPTDARGDVVTGVAANAGTTSTSGTARTTYTRLHWLG